MATTRFVTARQSAPERPETNRFAFFTAFVHDGRARCCLALLLLLVVTGAAQASSYKAKGLYEQGRRAELERNFDAALEFYEQAILEDTENERYDLAARRVRFVAGQTHVDRGQTLRDQGQLDEALAEFREALARYQEIAQTAN